MEEPRATSVVVAHLSEVKWEGSRATSIVVAQLLEVNLGRVAPRALSWPNSWRFTWEGSRHERYGGPTLAHCSAPSLIICRRDPRRAVAVACVVLLSLHASRRQDPSLRCRLPRFVCSALLFFFFSFVSPRPTSPPRTACSRAAGWGRARTPASLSLST